MNTQNDQIGPPFGSDSQDFKGRVAVADERFGVALRPSIRGHELFELGEFILPYEAVRTARAPAADLMAFLSSTYDAAATLAGWDRAALERRLAT